MQFKYTKISRPEPGVILRQVLSECPQYAHPLPCNVCISVTTECRHGDGVTW